MENQEMVMEKSWENILSSLWEPLGATVFHYNQPLTASDNSVFQTVVWARVRVDCMNIHIANTTLWIDISESKYVEIGRPKIDYLGDLMVYID